MQLNDKQGWTIPVDSPFYRPLPAYYRNVRFQFIFFQADQAAAAAFLSAPLKPGPNGICIASGLTVPFCSHYEPFGETFIQQKCSFRGTAPTYSTRDQLESRLAERSTEHQTFLRPSKCLKWSV